jgi:hypothetical protein
MKTVLFIDAIINFILGILLLLFSPLFIEWLGIPSSSTAFYPNILGAVFIGITIALLINVFGKKDGVSDGLGLTGAISINLCGGIVLAAWLSFGNLRLPAKGYIFLWLLVLVLIIISLIELIRLSYSRDDSSVK